MKKMQICSALILLLAIGCRKDAERLGTHVTGKWKYTEYSFSIGGPSQWHDVSAAGQQIEFRSNGSFVPSELFLKGANRYELVDSVTIKFQPAPTPSGYILMGYSIDSVRNELTMYNVQPLCIEGCGYKFRR